jgi:hypothetical protein
MEFHGIVMKHKMLCCVGESSIVPHKNIWDHPRLYLTGIMVLIRKPPPNGRTIQVSEI